MEKVRDKMKGRSKIISVILVIGILTGLNTFLVSAGSTDQLTLTGDLYKKIATSSYVLEVKNMSDYNKLNGRYVGFKINGGVVSVLSSRENTNTQDSRIIYDSINSMLTTSDDGKTYKIDFNRLTLGSSAQSAYDDIKYLLEGKLKSRQYNVAVEYYDSRPNGNPDTRVQVLYKFGVPKSYSNTSETSTGYVDVLQESMKADNSKDKNLDSENKKNLDRIKSSEILSKLLSVEEITVHLNDNKGVIPKILFEGLMRDKYHNKKIIVEQYNKGILSYKWLIPVDNIHDCKSMNMEISTSSNVEIDKLLKNKCSNYRTISFSEKGVLAASCTVDIKLDLSNMDMKKLKIYGIDVKTGNIEKKNINLDVRDNMLSLYTGYGGDYIITDQSILGIN